MKKWIDSLIFHWVLTYDDSLWFCVYLASHLLVFGLAFPGLSMDTFPHFSLVPMGWVCINIQIYTHTHTFTHKSWNFHSAVISCHSCCFPTQIHSSCCFLLAGVKFEKFLFHLCSSPPETKATWTACVCLVKQTRHPSSLILQNFLSHLSHKDFG